MSLLDKAKEKLSEVADKEKLQDVAGKLDEKTGGKLGDAVDVIKDKVPGADKLTEKLGFDKPETPEPPAPPEPPSAQGPGTTEPPSAP